MLGNKALLVSVAAVVVMGGAYGGLATFQAGHLPAHVTVDGVALGGMSAQQATVTLQRALAIRASRPVHLVGSSRTIDLQPAAAGLEIDPAATVADLSGFSLDPVRLWRRMTGSKQQPLKVRVDRVKLTAAVTRAGGALVEPRREGSISFAGGKATAVLPVAGSEVRVLQTVAAVASAWPDRQKVRAVVRVTRPKVSGAEIRRAQRDLAVPAMSGPVTVRVGSHPAADIVLEPRQYASVLSTTTDHAGRLGLRVDQHALMAAVRAGSTGIELLPVDATVRLVAGRPQVVPSALGRRLDGRAAAAGFRAALTSARRVMTLKVVPAAARVSTATARGWGVKEKISSFTTHFPVNPSRTSNIKIAVAKLNGTLIRPGEQFSLNATLGERTPAKGYQRAPVIFDGRLVSDYGGGVSQVSTATFNAAFFAGVRIDQHTTHSFYIPRYPEGREATVSWPDVDQKWTNEPGLGTLIQAYVKGSNITVTLWGTKSWEIEAARGPRRNVTAPKTIVDARPGCVAQQPAPGFDVTVTQIFRRKGVKVKAVSFDTHYIPENSVRCSAPKAG